MSDAKIKQARIAINFYGDDARNTAELFEVLLASEAGVILQSTRSITVFNPSSVTNLKQLTGAQQGELYQMELDIRYNIESTTTIKRIDTPVVTTITDD